MGKLTALQVRNAKEPGRYGDGDGLFLEVGKSGSRSWILRVQANGKRRDIGLGSAADVSLSEARTKAEDVRRAIREGRDPVAEKRAMKEEPAKVPTFREAALLVQAEHAPSWKNAKHATQWLSSLEQHAFPKLGDISIAEVTGPMVRDVLAEIWLTIPETARRVRQRIGTVLDWAHAKGWREAEAPLRAISKGLPKQPRRDTHFAAMPWQGVPAFLVKLAETDKAGEPYRLALEFLILTAVRSGEMRGARWGEVDLDVQEWRIPADRMKAGRAHTVPLSARALAILNRMKELRSSDDPGALVFEGSRPGRPMSDMTLTMILRRMGAGCTAHGFRSSFRDWAAEATNFPREVAEAALAHALESKVEAAYRRSDLLEKRRKLMDAWAGFCGGGAGKVVPMSRKRA
ncbi:tyrosine-type recombinase/integrase [Rhodocista pekingensis]|uniref:Tyrosine-type recombinase/integrase n=1 Tax=Rhodocista pekingensis TaxID=201185 RepID=A0ABW2KSD5_9PROT